MNLTVCKNAFSIILPYRKSIREIHLLQEESHRIIHRFFDMRFFDMNYDTELVKLYNQVIIIEVKVRWFDEARTRLKHILACINVIYVAASICLRARYNGTYREKLIVAYDLLYLYCVLMA